MEPCSGACFLVIRCARVVRSSRSIACWSRAAVAAQASDQHSDAAALAANAHLRLATFHVSIFALPWRSWRRGHPRKDPRYAMGWRTHRSAKPVHAGASGCRHGGRTPEPRQCHSVTGSALSVRRKLHERRAAASGAATWPCRCRRPFARTPTGDAIRAKNTPRRAPFGRARSGGRFGTKVKAIPNAARTAAGSRCRFDRPTLGANVANSPEAHSWREEIGRSLTDHLLDRRSFVVRFGSHPSHTIPLPVRSAPAAPGQRSRSSRSKQDAPLRLRGTPNRRLLRRRPAPVRLRTSHTIRVRAPRERNFLRPRLHSEPPSAPPAVANSVWRGQRDARRTASACLAEEDVACASAPDRARNQHVWTEVEVVETTVLSGVLIRAAAPSRRRRRNARAPPR
jgi:hypothetical protein